MELWASNPTVIKALVNSFTIGILDGSDDEGQGLLDELIEHSIQRQFIYHHEWKVGYLIMWDNRCTMHCVEPYDAAKEKRSVHRVVVRGDAPV